MSIAIGIALYLLGLLSGYIGRCVLSRLSSQPLCGDDDIALGVECGQVHRDA